MSPHCYGPLLRLTIGQWRGEFLHDSSGAPLSFVGMPHRGTAIPFLERLQNVCLALREGPGQVEDWPETVAVEIAAVEP